MIQEKFSFLIKDYSFSLLSSIESPRDYPWEGEVVYSTPVTYINIESARGETPLIFVGRTRDKPNRIKRTGLLSLHLIYEYMILEEKEREIVVSLGNTDTKKMSEITNKINTNLQFSSIKDYSKALEVWADIHSDILKKYANPFLIGDFSLWGDIYEYSLEKSIFDWIKPSRSEFSMFSVLLETGKYKTYSKKQYDENPLDYIEQLKKNVFRSSFEYIKNIRLEKD